MKKNKKKKIIIVLSIATFFLLIIGIYSYISFFTEKKSESAIVNEGVGMKLYIVDKKGNILSDISGDGGTTQSIISAEVAQGYAIIDNVNTFLAIGTQLDNVQGDSEITATDVAGTNPCNLVNLNPGCAGITNIFGSGGAKKGNLNVKWDPSLPFLIPRGQKSNELVTDPMSLVPIELGLIDFRVDVTGTYLDQNGVPQPLQNAYGKATMRISPEFCTDGTAVDPDSSNADVSQYCSTVNKGKYCRVGSSGEGKLTDRASLCGCPTNFIANGETCISNNCGGTWAINTCNPDGGVLFCKSDGSVESRCNQCTFAKCPKSVNGDNAIGCDPLSGEPSTCKYPNVIGQGFLIKVSSPTLPTILSCGDGIKEGAEQCDKFDTRGIGCKDLGLGGGVLRCKPDCSYDQSGCS